MNVHRSTSVLTLASLFVYPVKSLRGIALERANAGPLGLELDREWMLVDASGRSLTQIEQPRLALVDVAIEDDALRVTAEGMPPLFLPRRTRADGEREVKLFRRARRAFAVSHEANRWFSDFLGVACAVVRMRSGDEASFANQRPFHLLAEASWRDLAARANVPLHRFRPNLVVAGAEPYEEDRWSSFRIGDLPFQVTERTTRCAVTCVDRDTGTRGVEPLRTLAGYRSELGLTGRRVRFGIYASLTNGSRGILVAGDLLSLHSM